MLLLVVFMSFVAVKVVPCFLDQASLTGWAQVTLDVTPHAFDVQQTLAQTRTHTL